MKSNQLFMRAGALATALIMTASPCFAADASAITPVPGTYGYFVDTYKTNNMDNMTPESNSVIGLLSSFQTLWQPGSSWDNGTKLGESGNLVLDQNIRICIEMTNNRTEDQALTAYLTDRRNQNYSALDGLGPYTDTFKSLSQAATSLPAEIPADAETKKYSDKGGENGEWANPDSSLGSIVELVNTVRGPHASGNPAKIYYQYMRPYRWDSQVKLLPALQPCMGDPMTDGGFPSGHTNAGYLASLTLAYSVPERFQECLTNASEIGNYRIIAGMHSPTDVIGGRTMATALAAAALNDPENAALKAEARRQANELLIPAANTAVHDAYADHQTNKQLYEQRLTYQLPQTGATDLPVVVPKGAEVLLETRFPYLNATQRRWVLYSTGLPSGYAFLDDTEGWGRLNLYAAADGYGAFDTDVSVTMDAAKGGFSAYDQWRNDIAGEGCLNKNGTGTLVLSGHNSFTGGVHINDGTLIAASGNAFGQSSVHNHAAIRETVDGNINIYGDFQQDANGILMLDINTAEDSLLIHGSASLNGTLTIDFSDYPNPNTGMKLISANSMNGALTTIEVTGLADDKTVEITADGVVVTERN